MYKQLNINNMGIDLHGDVPAGYQHGDGLIFDKSHPSWIIQKNFDALSKDILNMYPQAKKFLDIGSGAGNFRYALINNNPELTVITIDGNRETIKSPLIDVNTHFILRTDIDYTIVDENNEIVMFDIICSFEHFEHIEPKNFDVFINNIKKHSHADTILIASAANWRYSNSNVHCNVKSLKEWDNELINKYGMKNIGIAILNNNNWSERIKHTFGLHYKINN